MKILSVGLVVYVWKKDEDCMLMSIYTQGHVSDISQKVLKGKMPSYVKLLFELEHNNILPQGEHLHETTFREMGLDYSIDLEEAMDSFIIRHMARVIDPAPGLHQLAFGNLLTIIFKEFKVSLGSSYPLTKKDTIDRATM